MSSEDRVACLIYCLSRTLTGSCFGSILCIELRLTSSLCPVFTIRDPDTCGREKIYLIEVLSLAHLHDRSLEVSHEVIRGMVLDSGFVVTRKDHEVLTWNIKLAYAVQDDMAVNVTGSIMSVAVSAYDHLMPGERFSCKFHSKLLSFLRCQTVLITVVRIEAYDVVMSFDFFHFLILLEGGISCLAFLVEGLRITVDTVDQVEVAFHHEAVLVEDRLVGKLVMLHREIFISGTVIGVMDVDVFNCCHGILLLSRLDPFSFFLVPGCCL